MYAQILKGAPLGNQNAAGPHNMRATSPPSHVLGSEGHKAKGLTYTP